MKLKLFEPQNSKLTTKLLWLASSTLLLVAATNAPAAAQVIVVEERFQDTNLNPTFAPDWRFGIGDRAPAPVSDPPCLTAAPLTAPIPTPLSATPPTSGSGFIPGCPNDTGSPSPFVRDPVGSGTLRLTPSKGGGATGGDRQATFVLFDRAIDSGQGLQITFNFYVYDGFTPAFPPTIPVDTTDGADGFSFFLINGTANPTTAGSFGGSLGYAQCDEFAMGDMGANRNRCVPNGNFGDTLPGIAGGYVGIGFDEFGNFSNPTGGRIGGTANVPDSIAIRGAGSGTTGYEYLTGTANLTGVAGGGSIDANQTTRPTARTARITLTPDNRISVEVDFGSGFVEFIPPLDLSTAPGQPAFPPTFKFGFAASTGGARAVHEIDNLTVTAVPPDLSINKTSNTATFAGGQNQYTLQVQNSASAGNTFAPITVTDTLPAGFTFVSGTGDNWACSAVGQDVTCTYTDPDTNFTPGARIQVRDPVTGNISNTTKTTDVRRGESLPPITLTVDVTAPPSPPTYDNTATVNTLGDSDTTNNSSTDTVTVTGEPRLGVAKAAGAVVDNGDGTFTIPYTVTLQNLGNLDITDLQVTENLATTFAAASSFTLVGGSLSSPTLTVNSSFDGNTNQNMLDTGNSLAVGATAQITFQVTINPGNTISYSNSVTGTGTGGGTPVSDVSTNGTDPDNDGGDAANDDNSDAIDNNDPTPITLSETPQLGVAKAAGTITDNGNGTFNVPFTITVQNTGNVQVNNLQVVENLTTTFPSPASFTIASSTSSGLTVNPNFNGSTDTNLLAGSDVLAVGSTATIDLQVTLTPGPNPGAFNNTASASGTSPSGGTVEDISTNGSNPDADGNGNPSDNVPTPILIPRLGVAKAAGTITDNGNGSFTIPYTVVLENLGNVELSNLQVVENLSTTFAGATSFTVDSISSPDGLTVNSSFNGSSDTNLLLASNPANVIAVAGTARIVFNVTVTPGTNFGPYNNTASGSATGPGGATPVSDNSNNGSDPDPNNDGNPNDNSIPTSVTFGSSSDLSVNKTVNNSNPSVGDIITYTIAVTNDGPDTATGVQVSEPLASGLTFQSSSESQGSYDSGTGTWTVGTLANGASATLTVTVRVDSASPITNTATASADQTDPDPTDNQSSVTVPDQNADLQLTKTVDNFNPSVGEQVTYTITLRNNGPGTATNVRVTEQLPAGLTFVSANASAGSFNSGTGIWAFSSLSNGAIATLRIVATVNTANPVTNTAQITGSDQTDPNPGNNQGSATVPSIGTPRLRLVKRVTGLNGATFNDLLDDPSDSDNASDWPSNYLRGQIDVPQVRPGDEVEYTIYFLSDGTAEARNVQICDFVPLNQTFVENAFNDVTPAANGLAGVNRGMAIAFGNGTALSYTNANDGDNSRFISPGSSIPAACVALGASNNGKGAILFRPQSIPNFSSDGNNSFGFIRFRARVD
ncbi:MAG: DUF11 domain-containing protein [Oscillatoria sp. SIO1A7]|nr:DUF11 domain-containing protein [Oscillatoria sp. SIO1A7]